MIIKTMETKICCRCNITKDIDEFSNRKTSKDGKRSSCKKCDSEDIKKWRELNKENVKSQKQRYNIKYKERNLDRWKKYNENNSEKHLERSRIWRENNKNYPTEFYQKNKIILMDRIKERKKNNPIFKLKTLYRSKTNKILGNNRDETFEIIGCTPQSLKEHLERQFKDGMTWENHGLYGWHIDHIIPLSSAKTEEELYKLCHYTNLQPLWAKDNLAKSNKLPYL